MDKGHIYILQYIKNLEDQVLADNYDVGKELIKNKPIVEALIDELYHTKNLHEINDSNEPPYAGYYLLESSVPEQKYALI